MTLVGSDERAGDGTDDPHRDPVEQALEVFVYAPLGFALEAHRLWPEVVARGRREVDAARARRLDLMDDPRGWLERRVRHVASEAGAALRGLGLVPGADERPGRDDPTSLDDPAPGPEPTPTTPQTVEVTSRSEADSGVDAGALAIPGYDSLSASQVVPRLTGLDPEELDLVRKYELAGRGRKTILSRIAQLQDG